MIPIGYRRYKIIKHEDISYVELVDTKIGSWIMQGWGLKMKGRMARKMIRKCAALNAAETRRRNKRRTMR